MSRELLGPAALGRLFDAGLRVQGLSVGVHSSGGQSGGLSRGVRGALPWDLGFTATLSREGLFSKVGKLFKRELQTGDAEFDGYVFIETESPEPLAAVLADETLRQRILETMQETQAWVKLDGSVVSLEAVSLSDTQVPRAVAHVAAVVERLAAVAAAVGSGKRREPAPYPDLSGHANLLTQGSTDTRFWPKALFLKHATLDSLEPVAKLHELAAGQPRRLEIVRLESCHLADGDLSPLARIETLREVEIVNTPSATDPEVLRSLPALEKLVVK